VRKPDDARSAAQQGKTPRVREEEDSEEGRC